MDIGGSSFTGSLHNASASIERSAERIASGSKINSAADDAAGLSISNRLSGQINGMSQSIRNANDGVSMLQTAEVGLQNITDGVQRLRELALQSANGTLTDSDRSAINKEAQHLMASINEGVSNTTYNNKSLLSGESKTDLQVGPEQDDNVAVGLSDFTQLLESSGFNGLDFSTSEGAKSALGALDQVQEGVDQANASIGSQINRLDSTINSLTNSSIQAQEGRSRISDADMAKEISDMANNQVKQDAAIAMQVLSNQQKSSVLRLLNT